LTNAPPRNEGSCRVGQIRQLPFFVPYVEFFYARSSFSSPFRQTRQTSRRSASSLSSRGTAARIMLSFQTAAVEGANLRGHGCPSAVGIWVTVDPCSRRLYLDRYLQPKGNESLSAESSRKVLRVRRKDQQTCGFPTLRRMENPIFRITVSPVFSRERGKIPPEAFEEWTGLTFQRSDTTFRNIV